jgi:hypothetical protein
MNQPNTTDIKSLKDFVKGLNKKKLNSLIEELGKEPSPFAVYLNRKARRSSMRLCLASNEI